MNGKVLVFLAAVCFIQAVKCDSISDLINELKPKVEEAAKRIEIVFAEGGNKSAEAFLSIQSELNVYKDEIRKARTQLLEDVVVAEKNASKSGKDIQVCVKTVVSSLGQTAAWQFEKCRISSNLTSLNTELLQLKKQKAILLASPVKCTVKSGKDLTKIKACVLDAIDVAKKAADKVEADIEPTVSKAVAEAKECGNERATELEAKIKSLTDKFNECVSKI